MTFNAHIFSKYFYLKRHLRIISQKSWFGGRRVTEVIGTEPYTVVHRNGY